MQSKLRPDDQQNDRAGERVLRISACARVHELLRDKIQEEAAENGSGVRAFAAEYICSTENDRRDCLKFKPKCHASGFDRLNSRHIDQCRRAKKEPPQPKCAARYAVRPQAHQVACFRRISESKPEPGVFAELFPKKRDAYA